MTRLVKAVLICGFVLSTIGLLSYNRSSHSAEISPSELAMYKATEQGGDYVGSDACKDCHEDQFKNFSHTSHAQLTKISELERER